MVEVSTASEVGEAIPGQAREIGAAHPMVIGSTLYELKISPP